MPPDPLAPGRTVPPDGLAELAAEAIRRASKTQAEVAHELGQSAAAVSMAVTGSRSRGHALRVEIVERYGGVRVSGPLYRIDPSA